MDSNLKWTLEGPFMKANPQCNAPKEITLHPDKSDWMDNLLTGLATVSTILCHLCNLIKNPVGMKLMKPSLAQSSLMSSREQIADLVKSGLDLTIRFLVLILFLHWSNRTCS
jgi:preprotein translocase subunit SecG